MEKENKKNKENLCSNYRNGIMEMVKRIENPGVLEYLHTFINLFLEKWG